jgi:hypothetical protein
MSNISSYIHWLFMPSSFEKFLFNSLAHLLIGLFVLLVFKFLSFLYILNINPLSDEFYIFYHFEVCLFILVIVMFNLQKLSNLMYLICQFLLLLPEKLVSYSENSCLCLDLQAFCLYFPSNF